MKTSNIIAFTFQIYFSLLCHHIHMHCICFLLSYEHTCNSFGMLQYVFCLQSRSREKTSCYFLPEAYYSWKQPGFMIRCLNSHDFQKSIIHTFCLRQINMQLCGLLISYAHFMRKNIVFYIFCSYAVKSVCMYDSKVIENNHFRLSLLIILWYQDICWAEGRITNTFRDMGKNRFSFFIVQKILEHFPVSQREHLFSQFFS